MLYFIYNTVADKVVTRVVNLLRFYFVKAELFTDLSDNLFVILFIKNEITFKNIIDSSCLSLVIPVLLASSLMNVFLVIIISPFIFDDKSIIDKLLNNP